MSRSLIRAKRGHNDDVVEMLKKVVAALQAHDGIKMKGYRIASNYVGDNSIVILYEEYESVADWDNSFQLIPEALSKANLKLDTGEWSAQYWDLFTSWDRDFWVVEAQG